MSKTIILDTPIMRGEQKITELTLAKPEGCGWLRGTSLTALLQMETNAITTVLPRVADPTLTEADVRKMDPADLTQCAIEVASFLLPKSALTDESPSASKTPTPTSP